MNINKFIFLLFILLCSSAQAQWNYVGGRAFSDSVAGYNRVAVHNGEVYAAYRDKSVGQRCTVQKFDGSNWVPVGNKGFSIGAIDYLDFTFVQGTPYVVFRDAGAANNLAVYKFDGAAWVNVGGPFGGNLNFQSNIEGISDSAIYVAFRDETIISNLGVSVMKWDGLTWTFVEGPNISKGSALLPDLEIHNNELYLVYIDRDNSDMLTMKKFDGSTWIPVGDTLFTPGSAYQPNIAFVGNTPHVSFNDVDFGTLMSTMKFDGTNWVYVGQRGYSPGPSNHNSLVYNGNALYSCFTGGTPVTSKVMVKKFNGMKWVPVGDSLISDSSASFSRMDISNDTIYVGYRDLHAANKMTVMANYTPCIQPDLPSITTSSNSVCEGDSAVLSVSGATNLGNATQWVWRINSENGSIVANGASVTVNPDSNTTYFVRGEGGCVLLDTSNSVTIQVDTLPSVNAGPDQNACFGSPVLLSGTTDSPNHFWSTFGTGGFLTFDSTSTEYIISPSDTSSPLLEIYFNAVGSGACSSEQVNDTMLLTFVPPPRIDFDVPGQVCSNLSDICISNTTLQNASGITWFSSGTGTFSSTSALNPCYTPSQNDISSGVVILFAQPTGISGSCLSTTKDTTILIVPAPTVNAGLDETACIDNPIIPLSGTVSTGDITWTTTGSGTFNPNNSATTSYDGTNDTSDSVELILTSVLNIAGFVTCAPVSDTVVLTYIPAPSVVASADQAICASQDTVGISATVADATGATWTSTGSGTFIDPNSTNTIYNLSQADKSLSSIDLIITTTGNGTCLPDSDTITLTINPAPSIDLGLDISTCPDTVAVNLSAIISGSATTMQWSGGSGTFSPTNTSSTPIYNPTTTEVNNGTLQLFACTTDGTSNNCQEDCDSILITFDDIVAPNVTCRDTSISLTDSGLLTLDIANMSVDISDNCGIDSISVSKSSFSCQDLGINTISIFVNDNAGNQSSCEYNLELLNDFAFVDAGENLEIYSGDSVQINATASNVYDSLVWEPSTTISDIYSLTPVVFSENTTMYYLTLHYQGCQFKDSVNITVNELLEELEIRNIITPNGDGKNDYWTVNRPELLDGCIIRVFSIWGKTVFESNDGYDNSWDGTVNGSKLPDGTYYYTINCLDQDEITDNITILNSKK